MARRNRRERGAVAVMAAILMTVIFAFAAVAVDLSNGFERGVYSQGQADFAALAGANDLPGAKVATDPAVVEVADYLNKNANRDDAGGLTSVTAGDLVDGDDTNGEVYFDTPAEMRVVAPGAQVDFTAGRLFGVDSLEVQGEATVGIFSPGTGPVPVFAVDGCDYGPQTFTDPAGGHSVPATRPPMLYNTEPPAFNNAGLDALSTVPTPVSVGDTSVQITIDGARFNAAATGVVKIGFFRDTTEPAPHFFEITPTTRTSNQLTGVIPDAVTAVEDVWWVRVYKGDSATVGSWSPPSQALPLRVGSAVLECDGSSTSGNFGTLFLPRPSGDVTSQDDMIAKNMADELEFDLAVMPTGGPAPLCTGATAPAVHAPTDGTNCVDTKTGMPALAATQGLITGIDGEPGKLDQDTSDRCQDGTYGGRPARAASGISGYAINDDILTCFFTNNTTTIEDISKEGAAYTSGVVLDPDIYSSPRFIWVPILHVPPSGGSQKYSIKEFRPAFITDQPLGANVVNHSMGTTTTNGLYVDMPAGNRVSRIKVVFFNEKALPHNAGSAPLTGWMGFGPKIIRLIN